MKLPPCDHDECGVTACKKTDSFPTPQEKPARRLTYAEKRRAGLVEMKPRARIAPIAQKRVKKRREYAAWIKSAMVGQRCA